MLDADGASGRAGRLALSVAAVQAHDAGASRARGGRRVSRRGACGNVVLLGVDNPSAHTRRPLPTADDDTLRAALPRRWPTAGSLARLVSHSDLPVHDRARGAGVPDG